MDLCFSEGGTHLLKLCSHAKLGSGMDNPKLVLITPDMLARVILRQPPVILRHLVGSPESMTHLVRDGDPVASLTAFTRSYTKLNAQRNAPRRLRVGSAANF